MTTPGVCPCSSQDTYSQHDTALLQVLQYGMAICTAPQATSIPSATTGRPLNEAIKLKQAKQAQHKPCSNPQARPEGLTVTRTMHLKLIADVTFKIKVVANSQSFWKLLLDVIKCNRLICPQVVFVTLATFRVTSQRYHKHNT